jgi:hypothetical protein
MRTGSVSDLHAALTTMSWYPVFAQRFAGSDPVLKQAYPSMDRMAIAVVSDPDTGRQCMMTVWTATGPAARTWIRSATNAIPSPSGWRVESLDARLYNQKRAWGLISGTPQGDAEWGRLVDLIDRPSPGPLVEIRMQAGTILSMAWGRAGIPVALPPMPAHIMMTWANGRAEESGLIKDISWTGIPARDAWLDPIRDDIDSVWWTSSGREVISSMLAHSATRAEGPSWTNLIAKLGYDITTLPDIMTGDAAVLVHGDACALIIGVDNAERVVRDIVAAMGLVPTPGGGLLQGPLGTIHIGRFQNRVVCSLQRDPAAWFAASADAPSLRKKMPAVLQQPFHMKGFVNSASVLKHWGWPVTATGPGVFVADGRDGVWTWKSSGMVGGIGSVVCSAILGAPQ